jgi:cytidylate kinase
VSDASRTNAGALVIAVDGPAAAGKGTLARRLAEHLNLAYLDTGLLYRAVGMKAVRSGGDPADPAVAVEAARSLVLDDLKGADLRSDLAAIAASRAAALPAVRQALLGFQRRFAAHPPAGHAGAILDGRDIGSVVCPDATVKLFITASAGERARRRLRELRERGLAAIHSRVLQDLQERDARDAGRAVAPLKPADDAIVIDSSDLDADAVLAVALQLIKTRMRPRPICPTGAAG